MFTGLIKHIGKVATRTSKAISIECPALVEEIRQGDSINVSGACLTATNLTRSGFEADLLPETVASTTLGSLKQGDQVNLELSLTAADRFGGHFVLGHVDGVTACNKVERRSDGTFVVEFAAADWLKPYLVPKGSIAIDGVSLTLQELSDSGFSVAIIPTTWQETTMGNIMNGTRVNIEADMLVKTIRTVVDSMADGNQILDTDTLNNYGYGKQ